ncbi:MAG: AAA family ATPase [Crocinitomicaceae bacterium]|nr:AAA family ATPase [Crocinitomicaceae bacterium]
MDAVTELAQLAIALRIEKDEDFRLHEIALRQRSISHRRKEGITWFPLKIVETGFGLGAYPYLIIENPGEKHKHYFQSSCPVSLFSMAEGNEGEHINGIVGYVDDNKMKISFYIDDLPDWVDEGKIGVNLMFDSRTYDEMFKALNVLINAEKGRIKLLRDTLLGYRTPEIIKEEYSFSSNLNTSQNEALRDILEAQDIAIVHGPPGTGKTTTLTEAIRVLSQREGQILVCAPSNAAVDHLTRKLSEAGLNTVRVGNLSRVEEDATQHTLDVLISQDREFRQIRELKKRATDLRKVGAKYKRQFGREEAEQRKLIFREAKELRREARELEDHIIQRVLNKAQAITCTLIGAMHPYLEGRKFRTVIIDEAGQALEPACWVPVLKAEKVVMAGDPFQLPPTVKCREAENAGLAVTLLEKAIQRHQRVSLICTQYRMNSMIMQFSNRWFYGGKLEADESVVDQHLPFSQEKIEFIDTAGCGYEEVEGEDRSKCNPEEAGVLLRHFESLKNNADHVFSTGVISPYRAQVEILEEFFAQWSQVTVNTIDSFQGQERDVIYISLVRSNEKGEIGFLSDYRRMNVAMTRAKKKLVIVGDSATMGNDKFYAAFLNYIESIGAYHTAWEWML